ncbi:hypothetical protein Q5752_001994 [Cryptotrichosporon argae]
MPPDAADDFYSSYADFYCVIFPKDLSQIERVATGYSCLAGLGGHFYVAYESYTWGTRRTRRWQVIRAWALIAGVIGRHEYELRNSDFWFRPDVRRAVQACLDDLRPIRATLATCLLVLMEVDADLGIESNAARIGPWASSDELADGDALFHAPAFAADKLVPRGERCGPQSCSTRVFRIAESMPAYLAAGAHGPHARARYFVDASTSATSAVLLGDTWDYEGKMRAWGAGDDDVAVFHYRTPKIPGDGLTLSRIAD